ncbi:MAG: MBL fold metallo-hydrolase [Dehalococcoidales bacterium]
MMSSCISVDEKPVTEEEGSTFNENRVTISVVYDNYLFSSGLSRGWGFGCVVDTPGETVLFDTGGDGDALLSNMEVMEIEPAGIETVVISHIHGDHTGGLARFLKVNSDVEVFIPESFPDSMRSGIEERGASYRDVNEPMRISGPVYSTGEMGTGIKEQSLIVHTDRGLVVITGCAHPGILNILERSGEIFPGSKVHLCMGGFHLLSSSDSEVGNIVRRFREMGVERVAPSHCSGDKCRDQFRKEYRDDFTESGAGRKIGL